MTSLFDKYSELHNSGDTYYMSPVNTMQQTHSFKVIRKSRDVEELHSYSEVHAYTLRRLQAQQNERVKEMIGELSKMDETQRMTVIVELLSTLSPTAIEYLKSQHP